jgi:hypothetical protein
MKITVLIHIYNEEYLLPFWLNHHKDIFDHGIIINYNSTDSSLDICKQICPTWEIRQSRNDLFGASEIDAEVMDIEETINGFKIALNVTEFLCPLVSLQDILKNYENQQIAFSITTISPYSLDILEPSNNKELFNYILKDNTKFGYDRPPNRYLHNYSNGSYQIGRHMINHPYSDMNDISIIWLGFFPMNSKLIKRKLQIGTRQPQFDIVNGFGFQHRWDENKQFEVMNTRYQKGTPLKELNEKLYLTIKDKYI